MPATGCAIGRRVGMGLFFSINIGGVSKAKDLASRHNRKSLARGRTRSGAGRSHGRSAQVASSGSGMVPGWWSLVAGAGGVSSHRRSLLQFTGAARA